MCRPGAAADFATTNAADCIVNLVYALGAEYRANATFVMNSKTAGAVRKMKDADGRFLWSDGLAAGEPARLMGYPVLICEDMPDIAANAYAIAFGDFRAGYTIAERPDLRILRDPFSAKPHVLFYATKRVGGDISDFAAIKLLRFAVSPQAGGTMGFARAHRGPAQSGVSDRIMMLSEETGRCRVTALPVAALRDHLRLGTGLPRTGCRTGWPRPSARGDGGDRGADRQGADRAGVPAGYWRLAVAPAQALPVAPVSAVESVTLVDAAGWRRCLAAAAFRLVSDLHRPEAGGGGGRTARGARRGSGRGPCSTRGSAPVWAEVPADLRRRCCCWRRNTTSGAARCRGCARGAAVWVHGADRTLAHGARAGRGCGMRTGAPDAQLVLEARRTWRTALGAMPKAGRRWARSGPRCGPAPGATGGRGGRW
jgi:hypothetical protein